MTQGRREVEKVKTYRVRLEESGFKINSAILFKINSAQAIEHFAGRYQPTQLDIRGGFSLTVQASFFLVCVGDSMGTDYCPCVIPRPASFVICKCKMIISVGIFFIFQNFDFSGC